jgi:DNA polymerase I
VITFDTETFLIAPGSLAPPLVCVSWFHNGQAGIAHWSESRELLRAIWALELGPVIGHNVAYDACVTCAAFPDLTPLVFDAYARGQVHCTQIREQLLDIRAGKFEGYEGNDGAWHKPTYALSALVAKYLGRDILASKGPDGWRLRYSELWHLPIADWPADAIEYPLDDARHTQAVYDLQDRDPGGPIAHATQRAAVDFALKLASTWGLHTSPETVGNLQAKTEEGLAKLQAELEAAGFVRPNGVRDTKAVKAYVEAHAEPEQIRRTAKGGISLSAGALRDLSEEHPLLEAYGEFGELRSVIAKDVKALIQGTHTPIHTRFNMAVSDRVTSSKPNVQNWRVYPGIRECFEPRTGYVYIQADYAGMELATLATVCLRLFGESKLADALIAKRDPHLSLGAQLIGVSYEECYRLYKAGDPAAKKARVMAKPANFGLPGGLGLKTFQVFCKVKYGVELTLEQATHLRDTWFTTYPEMRKFFAYVRSLRRGSTERGRDYWVTEIVTNRVRGGCLYTAACNDHFQALGASMSQAALFEVSRECYTTPRSPLWGSRPVNYVHDEIIAESPEHLASGAARRMAEIMGEVGRRYLPEVGCEAPPVVMRRWSKAAHELLDSNGNLIPWHEHACSCQGCEINRSQLGI